MSDIDTKGVPKTMLLSLYARAKHSKEDNPQFYDEKAIEIIDKLDYDFSELDKDSSMIKKNVLKTIVLDGLVNEYITSFSDAMIINIGSGMDTRFYRLDNGQIYWYNIDLSDAMAIRKEYFPEHERVTNIVSSAMDAKWTEEIDQQSDHILIIIESLTMYLQEDDVKKILKIISDNFEHVTLFVDIMNPNAIRNDNDSTDSSNIRYTWGLSNGYKLLRLNKDFTWFEDVNIAEGLNRKSSWSRFFTWIPLINKRMNYISILEKLKSLDDEEEDDK